MSTVWELWSVVCAGALCTGGAAWLVTDPAPGARRLRQLFGASGERPRQRWTRRLARAARARARPEWWCIAAAVAVAVLGRSLLPLVLGGLCVPVVRRAARAAEDRRERGRRADAVIALCGLFAGEVRAGRQPSGALLVASRESGGLGVAQAEVCAAARFGGDVPGALRAAAREPGAEGLLGLAACWSVAVDRGAGLACGVQRLEQALRAERAQRADLRAQLAGARSTALLLAGLPVLGLVLGTALGGQPLRVLLHSSVGLGCLLVGLALESAGLWWAMRIVRGAEEQ